MEIIKPKFGEPAVGQKFSPLEPQWKLDETTGEVVEDEPINMDLYVNSQAQTSLDAILDRFLPGEDPAERSFPAGVSAVKMSQDFLEDKFSLLDKAQEAANSLIEEFNLDPETDFRSVLEIVRNKRKEKVTYAQNQNQQKNQSQIVCERSEESSQSQSG